jgi:hypothetical protein
MEAMRTFERAFGHFTIQKMKRLAGMTSPSDRYRNICSC